MIKETGTEGDKMDRFEVTCECCKYRNHCPVFYSYNNAACLTLREADSETALKNTYGSL